MKQGKKVLTYEQQLMAKFNIKNEELDEQAKEEQKKKEAEMKEMKIMKNYVKNFLVFDDQNVSASLIKDWIFFNRIYRHLDVYVIYNIQVVTILTKQLRETCNMYCIFGG